MLENSDKASVQASVDYWWPRVAASFGAANSTKAESLKKMGLRRSTNAELRIRWEAEASAVLERLGLSAG